MSSMQERLQLKRVPLDTWNIREQLCLASAVVRSGDQNWMSVSRALKTVGEPNRPQDWYSQKSCAAQYGTLLENVETPKRKKRNSEGGVETPQESILKKLTQERIVEIQKTIAEMNQQYDQLKAEITEVRNPATSEDRLREVWANIENSRRAKERESARVSAWVQEREERRARAERPWRPPAPTSPGNQVTSSPAPPSSPLLTSLLKSSPVVTTPQHISHPANVVESVSPSVTAPTLSMLLEKSAGLTQTHHESKHAAIEHIKSQLVQIEHQLKANTPPPVPLAPTAAVAVPVAAPPAVDIDDIEIKAEDVYAFRDVDIHIQPVAAMHKGNNRVADKPKKDEMEVDMTSISEPTTEDVHVDVVKEEPIETVTEEVLTVETESVPEIQPPPPPEEPVMIPEEEQVVEAPQVEVQIAFPEVKFPTTEIKVIQPEVQKVKEEVKEPEVPVPEPEPTEVTVDEVPEVEPTPVVEEEIIPPEVPPPETEPPEKTIEQPVEQLPEPPEEQPVELELAPDPENIPLPPDPVPEIIEVSIEATPIPPEPEVIPEEVEIKQEIKEEVTEEEPPELDEDEDKTLDEIKKDEEAEDSIPLQAMAEEGGSRRADLKAPHHLLREDGHNETDDDTPMELSREEEKDGKKRRDYSRKKKSDSRTCSGSESAAEASAPESPSGTDAEKQHRLWKKSVMLVYSRLCAHKYASVFLRPISDEEAPGYSCVVRRPMDLHTIRRNIDTAAIRTTAEFQRDVLLMLSNALMYNSSEHSVYSMAKDMHEEARCQLGMLVAAQAHAGLVLPPAAPPARRKRRRPDSPASTTTTTTTAPDLSLPANTLEHAHKRHA